jgi:poly(3-hydroxybutyrate) depolymerase
MGTGKSAGCGKAPTIPSGNYNNGHHITITAANMEREYILNVPTNYDNTKPYKFVIAYHELNGNDDEMYRNQYYHLLPLSNNTTIFVAPNGQQSNKNCTQASGCGWPNPSNSDLQLADAIVAQIEENFCVDTNRIFATGWSYGGSMSYKTACERPLGGVSNGFVRAIAVYSGSQLSGNCTPSKPVAYYASHGTHDSVLNYDNGVGLAQNFAKANGCAWAVPTKVTSGAHVCTNLTGCSMGYPLEFCSFNGDHTPDPDNGQSGSSWEYQEVWKFLSQF